jgi:hypothetical protein
MGWLIRVLGFDFWQGLGIFLLITVSRMALGPTLSNGYQRLFPWK